MYEEERFVFPTIFRSGYYSVVSIAFYTLYAQCTTDAIHIKRRNISAFKYRMIQLDAEIFHHLLHPLLDIIFHALASAEVLF